MNVTSSSLWSSSPLLPAQNVSNSDDVRIITTAVMAYVALAIGAIGLTGNIFVVVVIVSGSAMRKQLTNAYIINQSLIDGTTSLFLILTTIFEDDGRKYRTLADDVYCRLWLTKIWLWGFFVSSTYNLLALTLERYLAVVHPIWHKMKMSKNKVAASVVFVWLFGPAYNLAYMTPTAGITDTGHCTVYSIWPSTTSQRAVGVLTIFVQYFAPLSLLVFFYTRMVLVLRRRVAPEGGREARGPAPVKKADTMARARKNILKTLAMVAFSFVFCWTWNQVFFLMFNLGLRSVDFKSVFYDFTVVMVFANCCINPFIYIAKYEQFQKTMKQLFCRRAVSAEDTHFCQSSAE